MGTAEAWNALIAGGTASHSWERPTRVVVVTPTVIHRHIGCAARKSGRRGGVPPRRRNARDATRVKKGGSSLERVRTCGESARPLIILRKGIRKWPVMRGARRCGMKINSFPPHPLALADVVGGMAMGVCPITFLPFKCMVKVRRWLEIRSAGRCGMKINSFPQPPLARVDVVG